ncbi:hypothetical protein PQX77_018807 [Marasmius sp. AFHP31]|nr:hypothetical protein PQX77_018807 [Marasmius sp. AFHP31]
MWWAYNAKEYRKPGSAPTSIWKPLLDSINYADFGREIWASFKFFYDYYRGVPTAHGHGHRASFADAFGVTGRGPYAKTTSRGGSTTYSEYPPAAQSRTSYDEDIRLAPYTYGGRSASIQHDSTTELNGGSHR